MGCRCWNRQPFFLEAHSLTLSQRERELLRMICLSKFYFHRMKYFLVSFSLIFSSCKTHEYIHQNSIPVFVQKKIEEFSAQKAANPPRSIYSYQYNKKTVYYISAPCCDIPSQVFDIDGTLICNPDGGISGKGDGKCFDFFQTRTDEKLIWKDARGEDK